MTIYEQIVAGDFSVPDSTETLGTKVIAYCPDKMIYDVSFAGIKAFTNLAGHIQGGFLCAMLDEVMSPALLFSLEVGQNAPTLELKTQFIKPVYIGQIEGRGKVISKGKQVCHLEGELFQNSKLVARATATALIV